MVHRPEGARDAPGGRARAARARVHRRPARGVRPPGDARPGHRGGRGAARHQPRVRRVLGGARGRPPAQARRRPSCTPSLGRMRLFCRLLFDLDLAQALLVFTATPGSESHEKLRCSR
nr:hypothetical protein [Angustibacter aerolatus]